MMSTTGPGKSGRVQLPRTCPGAHTHNAFSTTPFPPVDVVPLVSGWVVRLQSGTQPSCHAYPQDIMWPHTFRMQSLGCKTSHGTQHTAHVPRVQHQHDVATSVASLSHARPPAPTPRSGASQQLRMHPVSNHRSSCIAQSTTAPLKMLPIPAAMLPGCRTKYSASEPKRAHALAVNGRNRTGACPLQLAIAVMCRRGLTTTRPPWTSASDA